MKKLSIKEVKEIDMVDYLAARGHAPVKVRGVDYWYLSPLRMEKTASFKINRQANIWYDHGTGQGGNLIDFGILYHKCSVRDFLAIMNDFKSGFKNLSQEQENRRPVLFPLAAEKKETDKGNIIITNERPLSSSSLLSYLATRQIPLDIAAAYCKEVDFLLHETQHTAIGFRNDMGGYELRNDYFKGSSSPKTSAFIDNQSENIDVFEGFFSFLSFRAIQNNLSAVPNNFIILNSLAFLRQQRHIMEKHGQINLYLDRDNAGMKCTAAALQLSTKYQDQSALYSNHKDLNDWLVKDRNEKSLVMKRNEKQIVKQIKLRRHGRF